MKKQFRLFFFILGIFSLFLMIRGTDYNSIDWSSFFSVRFILFIVSLCLLWLIMYILHTSVYWTILGDYNKTVSKKDLLRICVAGFAINNMTPAGIAGGEPYRIMELQRLCNLEKATSTSLTFSIFYFLGHMVIWIAGSLIYLLGGYNGGTLTTVLISVVAVVLSLIFIRITVGSKNGPVIIPVLRFFSKLPFAGKKISSFIEDKKEKLDKIDEDMANFRSEPKNFIRTLLTEVLCRLLECLEYYLILLYLGQNISYIQGIMVMSIASLLGNILFFIPMQAGSREGGMLLALSWIGISNTIGIQAGVVYRIRELITLAVGISLVLIEKKKDLQKD